MISSLLHIVGLRPRVYYTLTNFRGGGQVPLGPLSIRQWTLVGARPLENKHHVFRYKGGFLQLFLYVHGDLFATFFSLSLWVIIMGDLFTMWGHFPPPSHENFCGRPCYSMYFIGIIR